MPEKRSIIDYILISVPDCGSYQKTGEKWGKTGSPKHPGP
jgi:hypothetical protein